MIRGLSIATSGMNANQALSDIIADNMANVQTPGYQQESASGQAFANMLLARLDSAPNPSSQNIGSIGTGMSVSTILRDNEPGTLESTGQATDLALASPGFFAVQSPTGVLYTRDGSFQLGPTGMLVTADGYPVLGQKGPIDGLSSDFQVQNDGTVMDNGRVIDKLQVVQEPATQIMLGAGQALYAFSGTPAAAGSVDIRQGMIESSNVNISDQMGNMISVMRAYEANQKVIQTEDSTLDKAVNDVGKV